MKILLYLLKLGAEFFKKNLKEFLVDRGNFLLYFFTIIFYQALFLIFIYVIFRYVPDIKGWNFFEILFIFGFFNIVSGLFYMSFAWTLWFPEKYILSGKLDILLTLPVNSFIGVLFEELARSISEVITVFLGVLYISFAIFYLKISFSFFTFFYFFLNIFSGVLILGGIFTLFTSLSFWFKSNTPFTTPFTYFIELAQYPIEIFNKALRIILTYILPISFAGFFPAASILRPYEYKNFHYLTFIAAVITFSISIIVWNLSIKRYESAGS